VHGDTTRPHRRIAMIAESCGFDAFYIDMEHCTISLDDTAQICVAALPIGVTPLVRIAGQQFDDAARLLDAGALGIICPNVSSRGEAEAFVRACRFPPLGERSVAGAGPLQGHRQIPLGEVNKQGNAATSLIAMLETPEGIANADTIAALPGIDVLLISSNDLCTAMGIPGELKNPRLRAAYEATAKACKAHGKILGIGGIRADVDHVAELIKLGARFVIAGSDVQYLIKSARQSSRCAKRRKRQRSFRRPSPGPHCQKSRPSCRMKRASTIMCTSDAPSTSRAARAAR
jgi:2-keto-3-deoxy-L-rhamnonate aldolase RhmA